MAWNCVYICALQVNCQAVTAPGCRLLTMEALHAGRCQWGNAGVKGCKPEGAEKGGLWGCLDAAFPAFLVPGVVQKDRHSIPAISWSPGSMEQQPEVQCPKCERKFAGDEARSRNIDLRTHNMEVGWICQGCARTYGPNRYRDLRKHAESKHPWLRSFASPMFSKLSSGEEGEIDHSRERAARERR